MSKTGFDVMGFLPYLLNQAAEQTSLEFQKHYKDRYGMLRTEWRVLFHLGRFEEMTANDIVRAARIHKTKVSRAVQALSRKGFLHRDLDEIDRRRETLSLTKQGKAAYADLIACAAQYEADLIDGLTSAEIKTLKKVLRRLSGR